MARQMVHQRPWQEDHVLLAILEYTQGQSKRSCLNLHEGTPHGTNLYVIRSKLFLSFEEVQDGKHTTHHATTVNLNVLLSRHILLGIFFISLQGGWPMVDLQKRNLYPVTLSTKEFFITYMGYTFERWIFVTLCESERRSWRWVMSCEWIDSQIWTSSLWLPRGD